MNRLFGVFLLATACSDLDEDGKSGRRDCDDTNATVFRGAEEVCDGLDNDCDGQIDEDVAMVAYLDRDGDGFGDDELSRRVCVLPDDGSLEGGDCNDASPAIHPDADEICDEIDNDCNGEIDDGVSVAFYVDGDGDGFGTGQPVGSSAGCWPGPGFAVATDDCDDAEASIYPGAGEICDGLDNDCDTEVDEALPLVQVFADADGDGGGDPAVSSVSCGAGAGMVLDSRDCDDTDPNIGPYAPEVAGNAIDEDCDGYLDELAVPTDYPTVEDALNDALPGSVIQLDDGTHILNVDLTGHDVTLAGNGCENTILYGLLAGSVLQMDAGAVENVTVSGGSGTVWDLAQPAYGGGLFVPSGSVAIRDACFEDNSVGGKGAAVAALEGSVVTIERSRFERNTAQQEGGALFGDRAEFIVSGSHFQDNRTNSRNGGAITVSGGHLDASNTVFAWNFATWGGSAIALEAYQSDTTLPEIVTATTAVLDHLTLHGSTTPGLSRPSTILVRGSTADITRSLFSDNAGEFAIYLSDSTADINGDRIQAVVVQSDNGFTGNEGPDVRFGWERGAIREAADYVSADPFSPDFRLRERSAYRDQLVDLDSDGSAGDLGAFGGPNAPAGSFAPLQDADADGLLDGWELRHGLPTFFDDAGGDQDGDGLDNTGEFLSDANPFASDSDDDGVDDLTEQIVGWNPADHRDQQPVADAGGVRFALIGTQATISAEASFDPNQDPLTFAWAIEAPGGSAITAVVDPGAPVAMFSPDVSGTYALTVTVDDGLRSSVHSTELRAYPGHNVPADHPTVADAVAALQPGEAISVDPGAWEVDVTTLQTDLVIFGTATGVVLQGNGSDTLLRVDAGSLLLADLTLQGGGRGAVVVSDAESFEGHRLVFRENTNLAGGALNVADTATRLVDSAFYGNQSVQLGGALYASNSELVFEGCRFAHNATADAGAAVYSLIISGQPGREPVFRNCIFVDNHAAQSIVHLDGTTIQGSMRSAAFLANSAETAIFIDGGVVDAHGLVFEDNTFSVATIDGDNWDVWLRAAQTNGLEPLIREGDWDLSTPREVPDLRPALYVRDSQPNDVWNMRLGSSGIDQGWVDRADPDGSRLDAGLSSDHPADGRWVLDADADGMSDGWEIWGSLDPQVDDSAADPDGDGLDNSAEHARGTHPQMADTDGDGQSDGAELGAALDPLDPFDNRPVADAGGPYLVDLGGEVDLDGSGSTDPNGDPLTYVWAFTTLPSGSALTAADLAPTPFPSFIPDVRGSYVLTLVVDDGTSSSTPSLANLDVAGVLEVPGDFATLDTAVAAAVTNDVIEVAAGVWPTRVGRSDIDYTIAGAGPGTVLEGIDGFTAFTLLEGGTLTLRDLVVARSTGGYGGAVKCEDSGLVAERVLFANNVAQFGGAMSLDSCTVQLTETILSDNEAIAEGGAMYVVGTTELTMLRTLALQNTSGTKGGAVYINQTVDVHLQNSQFLFNRSGITGGALYRFGDGVMTADHVTVAGNIAINGGGFYFNNAEMLITNSIFSHNSEHQVEELGITMSQVLDTSMWRPDFPAFSANPASIQTQPGNVLLNPRFVQLEDAANFDTRLRPTSPVRNKASDLNPDGSAGDLGAYGGPQAPIDWDFWSLDGDGDTLPDNWELLYGTDPLVDDALLDLDGDGLSNFDEYTIGSRPDLADTDLDGVDDNAEIGAGTNPLLPGDNQPVAVAGLDQEVDPGTLVMLDGSGSADPNTDPLTYTWSVLLAPASTSLSPADLTGADQQVMSFTPDVAGTFVVELEVHDGAAPSVPDLVLIVVRGDVSVPGDYPTPALGVAAVADGFTVTVGPGVFSGLTDALGKNVVVQGAGAGATILDGGELGSVVSATQGETLTLRDLTITGGFAPEGGGVLARNLSTVVLEGVIVETNRASRGAGLLASDATITATSSRIVDNDAAASGGGVHLEPLGVFSGTQLLIAGNGAWDGDGGGISANRGNIDLTNAIVADNVARLDGGGVFATGTNSVGPMLSVSHATFVHNDAERGGGVWFAYGDVTFDHTAVVGNSAHGLRFSTGSSAPDTAELTYTWAWQNTPTAYSGVTLDAAWPGNTSANPGLATSDDGDWTNDDWQLLSGAQAIDAGDPTVLDPDGTTADIGAFGGPLGTWTP